MNTCTRRKNIALAHPRCTAVGVTLPAIPALKEESTLIVPAGTFRIGRPIEVLVDGVTTAYKLAHVVDRTVEFERCTYSSA